MIHGSGSANFERLPPVGSVGWSAVKSSGSLGAEREFKRRSPEKSLPSIRSDRMRGVISRIESAVDIDYQTR